MIVVTGANGQLGYRVIDGLLHRRPAHQIVASVRDPAKATALAAKGVEVRAGDFAEPDALKIGFRGASQVLVISVNQIGEPALRLHRAAIDAAVAAGAQRVLYTSHMGVQPDSPFVPAHDHAATEAMLADSGVAFTSLRHGFYAESALHMIGQGLAVGEIRAPEDGPVSWTARADLAEADAVLLAKEGLIDGITPPLTASQALTMADIAAMASEVTGREIKRVVLSDQAWRDEKVGQGVPAPMAEMLLSTFRAARRGDFASTDPTLERLLRRQPQTMRDVLTRSLQPVQV